jgi:Ca2+-binding RTX toxin-like protein
VDGKVVLLSGGSDFILTRLNFDGSRDASFDGNDGRASTDFGGTDLPRSLAIDSRGRIVAVGTTVTRDSTGQSTSRFAVARYLGTTPPNNAIAIDGTSGNDAIIITQSGTTLTAKINGVSKSFSTSGKTKLVVRGHAGDDIINVASSVTLAGYLYGGAGKDKLHGGGRDEIFGGADTDAVDFSDQTGALVISLDDLGNDAVGGNENVHSDVEIVLGGSGNDKLFGNALSNALIGNGGADELHGGGDRDVLIGGSGKDILLGDAGDDLLIGSRTTYDADVPSLRTMRFEWANTANSYTTRINRLTAGVLGVKIDLAHIPNDGDIDSHTGGVNQDWFVIHATDLVKDKAANETVTKL